MKKNENEKNNISHKSKNAGTNEKQSKELVVKKEKKQKGNKAKWLKQTSLTVLLILIIVAVCIGINILVEKVNIADLDFTKEKIFSLSDMSKSMVQPIEKNVQIIIINPNKINESVGTFYNGIEDVAKKYNSINKKITIEVINDINSVPQIAEKYGLMADSTGIIVKSNEKEKLLSVYDIYKSDLTTGQIKNVSEEALTNAIIDVTTEEKPAIYYLTGHEKYPVDSIYYFKTDLEDEAYTFNELDLLTKGEVPKDCSVLMITSLAKDLNELEKDAILKYINKGGKIILFSDPNISGDKLPNFQKVLDEYGVELDNGVMIEEDNDKMLLGTPNAIVVNVSPYTSITKEINMNMNACFVNSGRIKIADSEKLEKLGVESEVLATTGPNSYYRTNYSLEVTSGKTKDDETAGNATVGALLKKKINEDTTSEIIVYSNNFFVTNTRVEMGQNAAVAALDLYNNVDLAINSIAHLTQRSNMITVRKNIEKTVYEVTEKQNIIILSIIYTIPVAIIIAGIIVWQYRRRKK